MTSLDLITILPEAALALYAIVALLLGAYLGKDRLARAMLWLSVLAMLVAAFAVGWMDRPDHTAFFGMFIDDAFARFSKVVILVSAAAVLAMSVDYLDRTRLLRFELPILVILAVIGMMVMVSAGDLLTLYMGLELQSLALYVVAALRRDSTRSSEAGLKYFVLGSLSSGMLLYGASLIYGFAGTTNLAGVMAVVGQGALPVGLLFGLVFLLVGLAFKISAVPFHMWTPDVYEGSPTPVTAFFATAPKVAAMALIARLMWGAFGHVPDDWTQIVAAMALMSMFLGSIAGIGQRDIKRLMAYSSIAHMGFALVGLAAGTALGVQAMLLYMAIYAVMNVGTFAFILSMERDGRPVTALEDLHLLARSEPLKALAMMILLFSLAGVPPMLGFFAKFGVLTAAVQAGLGWLAALGVIASVIGAYYYLKMVYFMYFGADRDAAVTLRMAPAQGVALVVSAGIMVIGAISMLGVDRAAGRAAEALVAPAAAATLSAPAAPVVVATPPAD
ncbi:NADH-quinone oxidoreductase subunit NuoN [Paracoccus endophyticus]|uniref:NADH-quinone oxidoreductase subunit NuoN n=1 Tax=Paracoccus endophyticus TaxID=2233774 RepID=UPI000DD7BC1A|nr:NADH-quinone oxidoreductase subunit NuoN [Paracoccus endophyticus]